MVVTPSHMKVSSRDDGFVALLTSQPRHRARNLGRLDCLLLRRFGYSSECSIILAPLVRLHRQHSVCKFSMVDIPPLESGWI